MSSLVRTLQKRILKNKFGFARRVQEVRPDGTIHRFKKGTGPIVDGLGEPTGSRRYPTLLKPTE